MGTIVKRGDYVVQKWDDDTITIYQVTYVNGAFMGLTLVAGFGFRGYTNISVASFDEYVPEAEFDTWIKNNSDRISD